MTNIEDRLTPANAGTTEFPLSRGAELKAHPRECGDDFRIRGGWY